MRIFVAIDLPGHVKAKIFHKFEDLQGKNLFRGKFVDKENLHLTLKFFGNISEEKLEEIEEKLRKIKSEKFDCSIGETGVFDERHIKVIWVDLVSDKLKDLQKQISDEFPEIPSDYKEFNSHITTVRVKSVPDRGKLLEGIKNIHLKNLDFVVEEFVLMKSELMRGGPKYKVLERYKLS